MLRRNGREGVLWNPIVEWTADQVFAHHAERNIPLHRAYSLGSTRLSCALCVMCSHNDAFVSVTKGGNISQYRAYVSLELRSAFPFQPNRWLADLTNDYQTEPQALVDAKRIAMERIEIQSRIPSALVIRKSILNLSVTEAEVLASARSAVADLYGISIEGRTAADILRRSRQ